MVTENVSIRYLFKKKQFSIYKRQSIKFLARYFNFIFNVY